MYNYHVRSAIDEVLGTSGSKPVTVIDKSGKIYYSTARESIRKCLSYGLYADERLSSSDGALDFYALADEYARMKS